MAPEGVLTQVCRAGGESSNYAVTVAAVKIRQGDNFSLMAPLYDRAHGWGIGKRHRQAQKQPLQQGSTREPSIQIQVWQYKRLWLKSAWDQETYSCGHVAQPHAERRGLKGAGISDSAAPVEGGNDLGGCGEEGKEGEQRRAPHTQSSTDLHPFGPTRSLPEIRMEEGTAAVWNYGSSCYGRLILTKRVSLLWPRQVREDVQIVFAGDLEKWTVGIDIWYHAYEYGNQNDIQ